MCNYCALSVELDFQDIELLVSIFPFLVDACKDLVSCKCISLQIHFSAAWSGGQRRSSGLLGDSHPLSAPCLWRWGGEEEEETGGSAGTLRPALGSATGSVPRIRSGARC